MWFQSYGNCCKPVYNLYQIILSKCLVYNFLIWYIRKNWDIFGTFLSEGLVENINQFFGLFKVKTEKPIAVLKP